MEDKGTLPEVFIGKGAQKICSKFTEEYPCRYLISIKLQSDFLQSTFSEHFFLRTTPEGCIEICKGLRLNPYEFYLFILS